jgi:very-short-patch-repair endonuclease
VNEGIFKALCAAHQLPEPLAEYQFAKEQGRKWRFDFAWVEERIAVDQEGGVWVGGRHTRGKGFEADCEKYAEAASNGWIILRFTPKMISDGRAFDYIKRVFQWRGKSM